MRATTRTEGGLHGRIDAELPGLYDGETVRARYYPEMERLGDEAEDLLPRRFAVINVWKPIRGPVEQTPLAFCDAQSLRMSDFVPTDLRYQDRTGEVYSLTFAAEHRWYYYPAQRADEALLLKCYDSEEGCARFTAHTAFDDPSSRADARVRESIEVRTLAFW